MTERAQHGADILAPEHLCLANPPPHFQVRGNFADLHHRNLLSSSADGGVGGRSKPPRQKDCELIGSDSNSLVLPKKICNLVRTRVAAKVIKSAVPIFRINSAVAGAVCILIVIAISSIG